MTATFDKVNNLAGKMKNKAIVDNTETVSSKANKEKYQELKLNSAKMGKCDLILLLPKSFKTSFWKQATAWFSLPLMQILTK